MIPLPAIATYSKIALQLLHTGGHTGGNKGEIGRREGGGEKRQKALVKIED